MIKPLLKPPKRRKFVLNTLIKQPKEKELLELWQEIIKCRVGYKCEFSNCYKTQPPYKLDAHHIYSKGRFKHLKFDLDNGICLCVKHHQAGWGKESAHGDINFKDKILGKIQGYKAIRTEQQLLLLERKAITPQKLDLNNELLYLKNEIKKYERRN